MHTNTLKCQFEICSQVLKMAIDGISHDESLRSPDPAGNCANWTLGHIVLTRNQTLGLVGKESIFPEEKFDRYKRGSTPLTDENEATQFEELAEAYTKLHAAYAEGLDKLAPEALEPKAPFSPLNNPNETVGSLLATLVFHESYHIGQLGQQRRLVGKPGAVG